MIEFDLNQPHFALVVGVGDDACKALSQRYLNNSFGNLDFLAVNTVKQAFGGLAIPQNKQILIGEQGANGIDSESNLNVGRAEGIEILTALKEHLGNDYKIVFILSALGRGTATGIAPVIAEICMEFGILVVSIVSISHELEEGLVQEDATIGLDSLVNSSDAVFLFPNDRTLDIPDSLISRESFTGTNSLFFKPIDFVLNSIFLPGYIRFDFEDIESILRGKQGLTAFISGLGTGDNRSNEAIKAMYASPYLSELKANEINEILLFFESGNDEISMNEIGEIVDSLQDKFGFETQIIWGSVINLELKDHIRINAMVSGEFEYSKSEFAIGG